jgi:hypothetical protein
MFIPCIIRRIRKDQQYALICTTPLFYVLAPTRFSSSVLSSGSFLDPPKLLEIWIEWVAYRIMCGYMTCVPDCRGSGRIFYFILIGTPCLVRTPRIHHRLHNNLSSAEHYGTDRSSYHPWNLLFRDSLLKLFFHIYTSVFQVFPPLWVFQLNSTFVFHLFQGTKSSVQFIHRNVTVITTYRAQHKVRNPHYAVFFSLLFLRLS